MKLEFFSNNISPKYLFSLNLKGDLNANRDLTQYFKDNNIEEVALGRDTEDPSLTVKDIFYCVYGDSLPKDSKSVFQLMVVNKNQLGIKNTDLYKWNNYEEKLIKFEVTMVEAGLLKLTRI